MTRDLSQFKMLIFTFARHFYYCSDKKKMSGVTNDIEMIIFFLHRKYLQYAYMYIPTNIF